MKVQLKATDEYGQVIEIKNLSEDSPLYKLIESEFNKSPYIIYSQIIINR